MRYNIQMKMCDLLENQQAVALFDRFLPGLRPMVEKEPQARNLSVEQVVQYSRSPQAVDALPELDDALSALNTPENAVSPRETEEMAYFQALDAADKARPAKPQIHRQTAIYPGRPWLDTTGSRIQAHAGGLFYEEGQYYWYGENKEKTDGKNGIWTWGIRAYRSADLMNWTDCGLIIPPDLSNPDSNLAPKKRVDRPHILKNPHTGQYVCWVKLSGKEACFALLTAPTLLGPYTLVKENFRPLGKEVGDFDIYQEETGRAILYFNGNHGSILCTALTEDYLDVTGPVTEQYTGLYPPFVREGIAVFRHENKYYMLSSGMTGYIPNRSDAAVADDPLGPFVPVGDPHIDDDTRASFNSQISQVFPLPGQTGKFIALADRWVPEYHVDAHRADLFTRAIAARFAPDKYKVAPEDVEELRASPMLATANTSIADYVWLPVTVEDGKPCIRWQPEWTPDSL